jgi:lauroyl/myristoyl acyltransferase
MDRALYLAARGAVALIQALPLRLVARLGRAGGAVAYRLDGRHRRVALANLEMCFGQNRTAAEIRAIARENFRRLGENFACAVKTASMSARELKPYLEIVGAEKILQSVGDDPRRSRIVAIGHFGNFELYTHLGQFVSSFRSATTYRALRQPALNRIMQSLRERSGCLFFERRSDGAALRSALSAEGLLLGLLADQHPGRSGRRGVFLGHECRTSIAPAVFALRYRCPLHTAICYRVGLGRWRIEVGAAIPTRESNRARSIGEITADINRAFETAILRDPANWFWVHNRWKGSAAQSARGSAAPADAEPASVGDLG